MSSTAAFSSPYDIRVKMVREVVEGNTKLGGQKSFDLAVQVLAALDHIPEKIR